MRKGQLHYFNAYFPEAGPFCGQKPRKDKKPHLAAKTKEEVTCYNCLKLLHRKKVAA